MYGVVFVLCFFFFKHKTAYEMRISDLSSDVCSSDLDHALLSMARGISIGLAHENADRASRIAYARRPPFAAVDHIMVAVTNDGGFDIGGVRGCDSRLGHQKDRANLPLDRKSVE